MSAAIAPTDASADRRRYTVEVLFEGVTDESLAKPGWQPASAGVELRLDGVDGESLQEALERYEFAEPVPPIVLFSDPREIRFLTGKFADDLQNNVSDTRMHTLRVVAVDGALPAAADLVRIGGYLGVGFRDAAPQEEPKPSPRP